MLKAKTYTWIYFLLTAFAFLGFLWCVMWLLASASLSSARCSFHHFDLFAFFQESNRCKGIDLALIFVVISSAISLTLVIASARRLTGKDKARVATNNINAWHQSLLMFVNRVVAIAYAGLACVVLWALIQNNVGFIGSGFPFIYTLALALGHFMCKGWALKASAVIFVMLNFLSVALLPPLPSLQIEHFVLTCFLAIVMLANYLLYWNLWEKSGQVWRQRYWFSSGGMLVLVMLVTILLFLSRQR